MYSGKDYCYEQLGIMRIELESLLTEHENVLDEYATDYVTLIDLRASILDVGARIRALVRTKSAFMHFAAVIATHSPYHQ